MMIKINRQIRRFKKQISKLEGEYNKENEQWVNEKNNIIDMQKLK